VFRVISARRATFLAAISLFFLAAGVGGSTYRMEEIGSACAGAGEEQERDPA
jgi:hypothetical protein